ncbi:hypothetical protein LAZ67_15003274 [Cordylochernes scorpioides]|uniref:Transposase n=1 Tax=Cordylochernes scorpioides TaxID=51811 RepID=A0ABY6LCS5_9ARAC|nr:hypothetical protein LAZ67_15003274 [Cordylochernes scorpioides]
MMTATILREMPFKLLIGKPTMRDLQIQWNFETDEIKCLSLRSKEVIFTSDDLITIFTKLCNVSKKELPLHEIDFLLKPNNNIGKTVNPEFYKEVLRRLHKAVKRKQQDLAQRWRLHHDNAPAHTAFLVTSYLTRIGVEVLPQPPYSPDMSPPDFFLFPKVKRCLKGHRFDDIPNIQRAVSKALTGITPTDYSGAYEAWKTRWQRCVDPKGEFFEEY